MGCFRSMSRTLWYHSLKTFLRVPSWQFWHVSSTIITWMMNDLVSHMQVGSKKILLSCGIPIKRSDPDLSRPSDRARESLLRKFLFSKQGYYQEGWKLWRAEVDVPLLVCFFSPTLGLRSSADSGHGGKTNQIAGLANVIQSSLLDGSHSYCGHTRIRTTRTARWSHVINTSSSEGLFWVDRAESGQFLDFEPQDFRI